MERKGLPTVLVGNVIHRTGATVMCTAMVIGLRVDTRLAFPALTNDI